ncbi:nicotinate-nucleotide adenylyltransferase [Bhargavaea beijingensis]|uniref:nicotinate-nucleotide adenylyltransferase n=1 Tax=Bhargavaea beijingensis TaxID=426756 RepID=UPI0021AD991D|nr:nicotinate-nucleotide adenylyltransferase [Bhargavaea beijingensis]MCW1927056.1 nicotinate-nucleotide adenylyltransferase [Bhargavaea beijingensis]
MLGGTFNPPHIGHLMIAEGVRDIAGLEEIRFMPNAIPPHKVKEGDAAAWQRLEMTRLAVRENPDFTVEPIEVDSGGVSYTSRTMDLLREREPGSDFSFIIGGDSIDHLHTWYDIDALVEKVEFIGVPRPGSGASSRYPVKMVGIPQIDLSSTLLREKLKAGRSVKYLIPDPVIRFIREEGLYGV